jgi:hypothetical protein
VKRLALDGERHKGLSAAAIKSICSYAQSPEAFHRGFSSRNHLSYLVCAVVHNSRPSHTLSLQQKSSAK